ALERAVESSHERFASENVEPGCVREQIGFRSRTRERIEGFRITWQHARAIEEQRRHARAVAISRPRGDGEPRCVLLRGDEEPEELWCARRQPVGNRAHGVAKGRAPAAL